MWPWANFILTSLRLSVPSVCKMEVLQYTPRGITVRIRSICRLKASEQCRAGDGSELLLLLGCAESRLSCPRRGLLEAGVCHSRIPPLRPVPGANRHSAKWEGMGGWKDGRVGQMTGREQVSKRAVPQGLACGLCCGGRKAACWGGQRGQGPPLLVSSTYSRFPPRAWGGKAGGSRFGEFTACHPPG